MNPYIAPNRRDLLAWVDEDISQEDDKTTGNLYHELTESPIVEAVADHMGKDHHDPYEVEHFYWALEIGLVWGYRASKRSTLVSQVAAPLGGGELSDEILNTLKAIAKPATPEELQSTLANKHNVPVLLRDVRWTLIALKYSGRVDCDGFDPKTCDLKPDDKPLTWWVVEGEG